ncbi:DUF4259 domain-containing protein [Nocardioides sp. ChNu-153]|uniref:DUF4259 domain-containing protein n=1 Tax=unclassified Nocardioides TaxID=2615069 RepID=UPI002406BD98|nr:MULTISPECIES: DUF4259 domain-containing protein [unclassified Nocardioides]MDF9717477.1 DUF4259 domain-containing protein [Nocardioides sp. ChNu-99]MDN7120467.1 DUF4259 domain-containing protein [Nocardioides sp. ChNu-153]
MGTWGLGPFDNDGAADLLGEIEDGTFSFDAIEWAFDGDYLDADGGEFAVALVELALVALEAHDPSEEVADLDLTAFAALLTPERLAWLVRQGERALAGTEASELHELWAEAGEDELEAWRAATRTSLSELRELT